MSLRFVLVCLLCGLFFANDVHAQDSSFYFYNLEGNACSPKIAEVYSVVVKTDSGYYRRDYYIKLKQLKKVGLYQDAVCKTENGFFADFYQNGAPEVIGKYVSGNKQGLWTEYYQNGNLKDSSSYAENGDASFVRWFENGSVDCSGQFVDWNRPSGIWMYFHGNGVVAAKELYKDGNIVNSRYFDSLGHIMNAALKERGAAMVNGEKGLREFLLKNLYFPYKHEKEAKTYNFITVRFAIESNGELTDIEIIEPTSCSVDFRRIVKSTINQSNGKWLPAIEHNRLVQRKVQQSIIFKYEKSADDNMVDGATERMPVSGRNGRL